MRTKLFVFLMLVSIVLSACGGQAATPAPAEPQEPAALRRLPQRKRRQKPKPLQRNPQP
jgi:hypothetical protein